MATDLEKAWKIVSCHRSFIGPDDTMPEDIAKAIVEGITLGRKEGLELAAKLIAGELAKPSN